VAMALGIGVVELLFCLNRNSTIKQMKILVMGLIALQLMLKSPEITALTLTLCLSIGYG
jgi:hypothetical protein